MIGFFFQKLEENYDGKYMCFAISTEFFTHISGNKRNPVV